MATSARKNTPKRSIELAGYLQKILTARVYDVAIESALDAAPALSARLDPEARRSARAIALTAASLPRSDVATPGSAMCRSRMPVRCTIHSSDVSTIRDRSSLVRHRAGR